MGNCVVFELLIYVLRIASIITMVLGAVGIFFSRSFFSPIFHLIIGLELLILSYSVLV